MSQKAIALLLVPNQDFVTGPESSDLVAIDNRPASERFQDSPRFMLSHSARRSGVRLAIVVRR